MSLLNGHDPLLGQTGPPLGGHRSQLHGGGQQANRGHLLLAEEEEDQQEDDEEDDEDHLHQRVGVGVVDLADRFEDEWSKEWICS
jgi:hypothetical protein